MSNRSNQSIESEWLTALDHARELTFDQLLRRIIHVTTELLSADAGGIYLFDEGDQTLRLRLRSGEELTPLRHTVSLGEGLAGRVAKTREPLTVFNYDELIERSLLVEKASPKSFIAIPLKTSTKTLGVLYLSSAASYRFTTADTHLLSNWSVFITIVLISAARLEYVRKTVTTQETLVSQLDQPRAEWDAFFEGMLEGMRDRFQNLGMPSDLGVEGGKHEGKLALVRRLKGAFKTESASPTRDEAKAEYVEHLRRKYS